MPIVAISRRLKDLCQKDDLQFHYIGPKDQDNSSLLLEKKFKIHFIAAGKIRRYFSIDNVTDVLFKIPLSFLESFFLILFIRPHLVFSKGGTGSLPTAYWAKIFRIPVFIHESDVVPGWSNKIASEWAKKIFVSFEKTEFFHKTKTTVVGNPIRKELLDKLDDGTFNLTFKKPVVLITGGSQGAEAINDFIMTILNDLLVKYEIVHVAGPKNYKKIYLESRAILNQNLQNHYHLHESLNEKQLRCFYQSSGLIISRAGSGSIFEIAAVGKPGILIPLPSSAGNHQLKNAYSYAKTGAAIVIEQENLTPNLFLGQIDHILSNQEKTKEMETAAHQFAKPKAAELIAQEILEYLTYK